MDYASMSKEQLIDEIEALAKRNAALQDAGRVTNKQVYTAVRNYIANELGIKEPDVAAIVKASLGELPNAKAVGLPST